MGDDRCVLLLGYKPQMEAFVKRANPGLQRRFQLEHAFVFDDYDDEALLRILLAKAKTMHRKLKLDVARSVVRDCLAKQRMKPNFGNAGAVDTLLAHAAQSAERRMAALGAAERACSTELVEADFFVRAKPRPPRSASSTG